MDCHDIYDISSPDLEKIPVPAEIQERCIIISRRVVLQGFCERCKGKVSK
ncbi:unnamed protein product [marine sediment metagenome]|uniref:Uncharacterized protein n=1 Tax=marine sediment metagenome TaxID=412755 RepID=X0TTZ0_9ZZZZ